MQQAIIADYLPEVMVAVNCEALSALRLLSPVPQQGRAVDGGQAEALGCWKKINPQEAG